MHIQDLGQLFVALVRAALSEKPGADIWDLNGVYLTGSGETVSLDQPRHWHRKIDTFEDI